MSAMKDSATYLVPNFRVAIQAQSAHQKPPVYRSSRLDALPDEKVSILRNHYGVKTILDLRSDREIDLTARSALNRYYLPVVLNPKKDPKVHHAVAVKLKPDPLIDPGERFILSLIGARSFFALLRNLPNCCWRFFAFLCLICDYMCKTRLLHKHIMARILNDMGLENFNLFLIDNCQREIGTAIHVFTESTRYPLLINCSQGKDRTGLIVALLQLISEEYTPEETISHYSESYGLLKDEEVLKEVSEKYYLNDDWKQSRPETMRHIIEYIDTQYTSVRSFLELCGVDEDEQNTIKNNLAGLRISTADLDAETAGASSGEIVVQIDNFKKGITDEERDQLKINDKMELQILRPTSSMVRSIETDDDEELDESTNKTINEIANDGPRDESEGLTNGEDNVKLIAGNSEKEKERSKEDDTESNAKPTTVELVPAGSEAESTDA